MKFSKYLCLLGFVGMFLFAQVASARFYLNPVGSDSSWIELPVVPGTQVSSEFVLVNGGEEERTFTLSVVDAEATQEEDGFFALAAETSKQTGIGLWGKLRVKELVLDAGESKTLTVNFTVPEDTDFGDYWGGVAAMEKENTEATTTDGLKIAVRNGLRVHLEVMSEEDYAAFMATKEEPVQEEVTTEVVTEIEVDYALWLKGGALTLILAILIAFLKVRGGKKNKSKKRSK